jgi:hypothetical protein
VAVKVAVGDEVTLGDGLALGEGVNVLLEGAIARGVGVADARTGVTSGTGSNMAAMMVGAAVGKATLAGTAVAVADGAGRSEADCARPAI